MIDIKGVRDIVIIGVGNTNMMVSRKGRRRSLLGGVDEFGFVFVEF